jgi:hypothetical protein
MHTTVLDLQVNPAAAGQHLVKAALGAGATARRFCALAVPAVGFTHSEFRPGTAPTFEQLAGSGHISVRRSRTAAALDYVGAAFVLLSVVFGPALGWLIFS